MGSHFQAGVAADSKTSNLARAQMELEEMYMGVPDESVNLTFQHLAQIKQHKVVTHPMISPATTASVSNTLSKLPSLDFNRGIQVSRPSQYHHQTHISTSASAYSNSSTDDHGRHLESTYVNSPALPPASNMKVTTQHDMYDQGTDADKVKQSVVMRSPVNSPRGVAAGRQGIPHSKICAICNRHVYVFRHRCLVCGRVYCRNCVNIGMGEMTEGRKCVECLGRRFSQRYIQRAGKTDKWWRFCCWYQSYPDKVKQQEIKWAQKGPRVTTSRMTQNYDGRSRSSIITMQPSLSGNHWNQQQQQQRPSFYHHDNPPSFVCATPRSPNVSSPYLHF